MSVFWLAAVVLGVVAGIVLLLAVEHRVSLVDVVDLVLVAVVAIETYRNAHR